MKAIDVRGRLVPCNACGGKKLIFVGNELYLNGNGRNCFRNRLVAENPATIVGFSRKWDYILRVRFEGQKSIHDMAFSHFHIHPRKLA